MAPVDPACGPAASESQPRRYECKLTSISSALRSIGWSSEPIDLVKVDVEGDELEALRGIEAHDWPRIRQVVVEVCGRCRLAAVCASLESLPSSEKGARA